MGTIVDHVAGTAAGTAPQKALERAFTDLPALPETVTRALQLLADETSEPADLARCLEPDPVLVGRVLAVANSAFYALPRRVTTIVDAVVVLGFRGLRTLLLTTGTAPFFAHDFTVFGHVPGGLWAHSLAVACSAREVARAVGLTPEGREELFVAGLLHDIGKLVLVRALPSADAIGEQGLTPGEERRICGIDHAEAAALIASHWNMSPTVRTCLQRHHEAPADDTPVEESVAIVRLADAIAHELGIGLARAATRETFPADRAALRLRDGEWDDVRDRSATAAHRAVADLVGLLDG